MPLFLVTLPRSEINRNIFNLTEQCYLKIVVEPHCDPNLDRPSASDVRDFFIRPNSARETQSAKRRELQEAVKAKAEAATVHSSFHSPTSECSSSKRSHSPTSGVAPAPQPRLLRRRRNDIRALDLLSSDHPRKWSLFLLLVKRPLIHEKSVPTKFQVFRSNSSKPWGKANVEQQIEEFPATAVINMLARMEKRKLSNISKTSQRPRFSRRMPTEGTFTKRFQKPFRALTCW
ncbi:hypothetical protein TNCV_3083721 [Trichonephila clavipes]|nr:hypothetical protein TNCV_3083721 [Trichonephila clavipes]